MNLQINFSTGNIFTAVSATTREAMVALGSEHPVRITFVFEYTIGEEVHTRAVEGWFDLDDLHSYNNFADLTDVDLWEENFEAMNLAKVVIAETCTDLASALDSNKAWDEFDDWMELVDDYDEGMVIGACELGIPTARAARDHYLCNGYGDTQYGVMKCLHYDHDLVRILFDSNEYECPVEFISDHLHLLRPDAVLRELAENDIVVEAEDNYFRGGW